MGIDQRLLLQSSHLGSSSDTSLANVDSLEKVVIKLQHSVADILGVTHLSEGAASHIAFLPLQSVNAASEQESKNETRGKHPIHLNGDLEQLSKEQNRERGSKRASRMAFMDTALKKRLLLTYDNFLLG